MPNNVKVNTEQMEKDHNCYLILYSILHLNFFFKCIIQQPVNLKSHKMSRVQAN